MSPVIDTNVQPHFRHNSEIRRYLSPAHKLRAIPDVEQQWYQAPGGDYREDLYGDGYPASDPETVARHLFDDGGADYAILNPLTRGNIADYLLNSRICAGGQRLADRPLARARRNRTLPWDDPRQSRRRQGCGRRDRTPGRPPEDGAGRRSAAIAGALRKAGVRADLGGGRRPRVTRRGAHQRRQRCGLRADLRRTHLDLSRLCRVHAAQLVRPPRDADHRGRFRQASRT